MIAPSKRPVVLVFAGHDPSGAAGIQADIESITATGCHAVSVITALTEQNTCDFIQAIPQNPLTFRKQIELLLSDIEIDACKIGILGDPALTEIIADSLTQLQPIPVVLDPVLAAGSGKLIADKTIIKIICQDLLPLTTVLTPNIREALSLSECDDRQAAAEKLLDYGCGHILMTGADEKSPKVINTLFSKGQLPLQYEWERLAGVYHGSGCTLASALAAYLAKGEDVKSAATKAQSYAWNALKQGGQIGKGQKHPNRFFIPEK